jgi:hypothetical protein
VQGLNIAGNFLPTVGPIVQMPLSAIIPAKPGWEEVRALLLPYGESPSLQSTLVPDWMEKVISASATTPSPTACTGACTSTPSRPSPPPGSTTLTTHVSVAKMKSDAADKARTLMILRGLGQFTLPASPQPEEKIHTNQGDIMASQLSKEFVRMEKEDYQTAVGRFIDTYGEGPSSTPSARPRPSTAGLSPSKAFGDWEQSHGGFLGSYSKVGGFFGPVGDDFSMEVYQRQLDQGERKRLTDQQMLDASQSTIARWKYNQACATPLGVQPSESSATGSPGYKDALQASSTRPSPRRAPTTRPSCRRPSSS